MPIRQMNLSAPSVRGARRPWGRWALRGVALTWVIGMVLLPVSALVESGLRDGARAFWREVTSPIAFAALELTLLSALMMTAINMALGTLTAYVLVRYRFPGNRLLDSLIDLPFAIPTLVTGLMLVALYGPQHPPGAWFEQAGAQIIFARPGIVLALLFVTYPFVIRSVQPVLLEIDPAQEEAADLCADHSAGDCARDSERSAPEFCAGARRIRRDRHCRGKYSAQHADGARLHLRADRIAESARRERGLAGSARALVRRSARCRVAVGPQGEGVCRGMRDGPAPARTDGTFRHRVRREEPGC